MSVPSRPDRSIGGSTSLSAGRVAAGKMYLAIQGLVRARPVPAADRVQQRHAVRLQAARDRLEERPVITDADMLEHADRDDAIERAVHRAIVEQLEGTRSSSPSAAARAALPQLLGRQRDAGHARAVVARQRQRQAAPAAADVQHREIRAGRAELGGDVPLLGRLRLFQRLVAAREVGARILPVAIQEQAVEPAVQVVVMGDVAPRAAGRVELVEAPPSPQPTAAEDRTDGVRPASRNWYRTSSTSWMLQSTGRQAAVHVGFAEGQLRIQRPTV